MKRILIFLFACAAILACEEKKETKSPEKMEQDAEYEINDSTIYGRCVEAANFTVILATPSGDTIEYIIPADSNADERIKLGGVFTGDKMAITYLENEDQEKIATRIINISTLLGKWTDGDRRINIEEGSSEWKILNGLLLLDQDTFNIYDLGHDTLVLENNTGIYNYHRIREKIPSIPR